MRETERFIVLSCLFLSVLLLSFGLFARHRHASLKPQIDIPSPQQTKKNGPSPSIQPQNLVVIQQPRNSVTLKAPQAIKDWILNPQVAVGDRREAMLELTKRHDHESLLLLGEIAREPVKLDSNRGLTQGSRQYTVETGFRITALEAIDQRANEVEAKDLLEQVMRQQKNPTLRSLARISLLGIREGRPGKLKRYIEKLFAEVQGEST